MQCPLCADFSAPSLQLLLRHIGRVHANREGFKITCGIGLCKTTFRNFKCFKAHLKKEHKLLGAGDEPADPPPTAPHLYDPSEVESGTKDGELEGEDMETQPDPQFEQLKRRALWILKLKERRKLTQSTLDEVLEDVTELCTDVVTQLGDHVAAALMSAGMTMDEVPGLSKLFSEKSEFCQPFSHLNTYHRQLSFYRANFNFVDPIQLFLGDRHVVKGTGPDRHVKHKRDTFVYIPLLKTIESLLQDEAVLEEVTTSHQRVDGIKEDFCDSASFMEHPLFSINIDALQLLLYYDDVEICNPLGSKRKKHKLGCFYFTLGNLHPRHRSTLNSIQLLALVKADFLQTYGMDKVLEPIVSDIQKLEKGVVFQSANGPLPLKGTVATGSADNLGSHSLGGFKEGGRALRCCRHCMVPSNELDSKFTEDDIVCRTPEDHLHHCQLLEGPMPEFYSTNYGVNRNSLLNSLDFFHVCSDGLPPDIMHDILEGYLPYTVKLMLNHYIAQSYLRLDQINLTIEQFDYGVSDASNKPSSISHPTLTSQEGSGLAQSATQMWCLGRFLPLMIGHLVPESDPHWLHFIQLLDIMELVFAPTVHPNTPPYLQILIAENLETFKTLYPTQSFKPKMHYLIHVPRYLERVGPLIRHWTMRYEAKHQYFKRLANTMGNYINVCHSLAMRHACLQCYLHTSEAIITTDDQEIGKGSTITFQESEFSQQLQEWFGGAHDCQVFRASSAKVQQMSLKTGIVVVMGTDERGEPEFTQIHEILVNDGNKVLLGVKAAEIVEYNEHFHSWVIRITTQKQLIQASELATRQCLTPRVMRNAPFPHKFVTLKYAF